MRVEGGQNQVAHGVVFEADSPLMRPRRAGKGFQSVGRSTLIPPNVKVAPISRQGEGIPKEEAENNEAQGLRVHAGLSAPSDV